METSICFNHFAFCSEEEEIRETFKEMDKDGDGFVTAAEISIWTSTYFDEDLTAGEVNFGKPSKNFSGTGNICFVQSLINNQRNDITSTGLYRSCAELLDISKSNQITQSSV